LEKVIFFPNFLAKSFCEVGNYLGKKTNSNEDNPTYIYEQKNVDVMTSFVNSPP